MYANEVVEREVGKDKAEERRKPVAKAQTKSERCRGRGDPKLAVIH